MKIRSSGIITFLMVVFVGVCVIFPGDPYNIKIITLLILLLLSSRVILSGIRSKEYQLVTTFGLVFPLVVMAQSSLYTGNVLAAVTAAYSPIIFLLIMPIIAYDIPYKEIVIKVLKIMALMIVLIALADILGVIDVNANGFYRLAFYDYGIGVMGKSPAYSTYYRIFMKASPLLVLLLDDSISKKKYVWVIIAFAALLFSGTRANVFSAFVIVFIRYAVWNDNSIKGRNRVLISLLLVSVALLMTSRVYNSVVAIMSTAGSLGSDLVRQGLFQAYIEIFRDPAKLLFGSGFGISFYNYGRDHYSVTSELSYFELIRCVGLVLAIPFFVFVIKPLFSSNVKRDYKLSYLCYLIIAATNPLLFSSTAMVMYIFIYLDDIAHGKNYNEELLN